MTATNPGGHSSLPVPDNAIYHIAGALGRLAATTFPFELNPVTREYFRRRSERETGQVAQDMKAILFPKPDPAAMERLSKDAFFNSTMRTTCVATRLNAGHANNALPQTAQANVNCRILPGHSPEEVRQQLIAMFADPQVKVEYVSGTGVVEGGAPQTRGFTPIAPSAEILKPLEKLADEMWPGAPVLPVMETGASDSIYTAAAGLPTYGISGMAIDQDDVRAHGKDERIPVASFYQGVDFFYRYLKALTGGR